MKNLRNQYAPAPAPAAAPLVPADLLSDKIMALEKACISVLEEHLPQPALLRRSSREGQFLAPALAPALAPSSASSSHDGGADLIVQLNRLQAQLLVVKSCLAEQRRPQQQQRRPSGEQRRPSGEQLPPGSAPSPTASRRTPKVIVCSPQAKDMIAASSGFAPVLPSEASDEEEGEGEEDGDEEEEDSEDDLEEELAEGVPHANAGGLSSLSRGVKPSGGGSALGARPPGAEDAGGGDPAALNSSLHGGRLQRGASALSEIAPEDIEQLEVDIEDPDALFDNEARVYGRMARVWDGLTRKNKGGRKKPSKSMAIQLNDPMCEPSTLIYCLFRYRRNRPLVHALLEKLEESQHPDADSYSLHLCYLLLLEPLSAPLEEWLVMRSRTSLHFALQVYWFCQGMIEDHDPRPGPTNYKRFLRIQREVQTGVGSKAEEKASSLMDGYAGQRGMRPGRLGVKDRKGKMRSLEATNRALADAIELRTIFHDVTRFVEQLAGVVSTLRQTEPRAERDATLIRELEALQASLPEQAHLPGKMAGEFQKVLAILPREAKSYSQREKNPFLLVLEVAERLETDDGLADSESHVSSLHEQLSQRRSRKQLLKNAMIAPGRVALRGGKAALHGVAYGVGGPTAWVITKSRAGVGATVDGVRERKAKHQQRREAALAQENDPFAITETPVEKTARMQQVDAPPAIGVGGRATTPEAAHGAALNAAGELLGEAWGERQQRIRQQTTWSDVPGWGLAGVLVKADDDLRQQMFCMHLIRLFQRTFRREGLDGLADGLRPYAIQATSAASGLLEALPDATSLAEVKRRTLKVHNSAALDFIYRLRFGPPAATGSPPAAASVRSASAPSASSSTSSSRKLLPSLYPSVDAVSSGGGGEAVAAADADGGSDGGSDGGGGGGGGGGSPSNVGAPTAASAASSKVTLEEAKRNCMHSVAAYSLVQYILQLKDRHNGNVLLDSTGRLIHVDFQFVLGWAPGGITFEKAAFKLTKDVVDVWGGRGSPLWDEFVQLIIKGLQALQVHHELFLRDVEVLAASGARFPCLRLITMPRKRMLQLLRRRFKIYKSAFKLRRYANSMIDEAYDNFWTRTYAKFQLLTNGIPP